MHNPFQDTLDILMLVMAIGMLFDKIIVAQRCSYA